jgi:hypothetical protein
MTSRAHTLVIEERSCSKVYVFAYTCSWAQVSFILARGIFWDQRTVMVYLEL